MDDLNALRNFDTGEMLTVDENGGTFLPISSDPQMVCRGATKRCATAGDARVNEQPALGMLHTIFVREHNRLVRELRKLNPNLQGERLFLTARQILNAEYQHIIYNEFIPSLLGHSFARDAELLSSPMGFSAKYNQSIDGRIANEFATAAFRVGHTLVNSIIKYTF